MRRRRPVPRDLFLLAVVAVAALAMISSPAGTEAASLRDLDEEGTSVVVCLVQRCRWTDEGYLLNLSDTSGGRADGFCRYEDAAAPPANRSAVRIWAQPSGDDPGFLFISRLEVLPAPVVREALINPTPLIEAASPCSSPSTIPTPSHGCAPPILRWS